MLFQLDINVSSGIIQMNLAQCAADSYLGFLPAQHDVRLTRIVSSSGISRCSWQAT
ncbi:hypothetical protein OAH46_01305 [Verrucomicrobia bacterium]|nr:hypothetical protein [Verrucomicrobiota bacterium]